MRTAILIATCQRGVLLERTLKSVVAAYVPETVSRIFVVENGGRLGAERMVAGFVGKLPIRYLYSEAANKSRALNLALDSLDADFIIFFDDDVRIAPTTISAYVELAGRTQGEFFAGGRCSVDYEEAPPDWLMPYLPPSAKGWSLGEKPMAISHPDALGFNWCAHRSTIQRLGGFNEERGPGTEARGQERDMQARMLHAGIRGFYIPDAVVWHFVPRERCSPEWALERVRQTARFSGADLATSPWLRRWRNIVRCGLGITMSRYRIGLAATPQDRFEETYKRERDLGTLEGLRLAKLKRRAFRPAPIIG